ncbi:MAG: DUF3789 domain-containing protein [Pseudomonadales bacterium]|nr:DUF3789 domain-containing protein [Pseudomonadales bacterium]
MLTILSVFACLSIGTIFGVLLMCLIRVADDEDDEQQTSD